MPKSNDTRVQDLNAAPLTPDELEKLIVKLRWIGLEEEAAGLHSLLARVAPHGGCALWPMETD